MIPSLVGLFLFYHHCCCMTERTELSKASKSSSGYFSSVYTFFKKKDAINQFPLKYFLLISSYTFIRSFALPSVSNIFSHVLNGSQIQVPFPFPRGNSNANLFTSCFFAEYSTTIISLSYLLKRSFILSRRSSSVPCHFG